MLDAPKMDRVCGGGARGRRREHREGLLRDRGGEEDGQHDS